MFAALRKICEQMRDHANCIVRHEPFIKDIDNKAVIYLNMLYTKFFEPLF